MQPSLIRLRLSVLPTLRSVTTVAESTEWEKAKPYKDVPGPKPLPIIGNTWRFAPFMGKNRLSIDRLQKSLWEYGDIAKLSGILGNRDMLMIFDPNEIEKVYRREGKWPTRYGIQYLHYYRTITRKEKFENALGLLSTQHKEWYDFRTKVNPVMMKPSNAKMYIPTIEEVAEDFIKRIEVLKDKNEEMPADFLNELNKWSLESIVLVALDTRLGCFNPNLDENSDAQKMINNVHRIFELTMDLEFFPSWKLYSSKPWKTYVQTNDDIYEFCMKHINRAIGKMKGNREGNLNILEQLIAKDPKTAVVMAIDMISAGVDTTSNTVSFVLYHLAKNPDKQSILFEELRKVFPNPGDNFTTEKMEQLKYLRNVIKESLRMEPTFGAIGRSCATDMVILGYQIPKGVNCLFPMQILGRSEKYFENPNSFIPERWFKESKAKIHPFTHLHFGFGARMCIGKRFADLEAEILIAKIIRNYQVEYNYGKVEIERSVLNYISSPFKLKMVRRT